MATTRVVLLTGDTTITTKDGSLSTTGEGKFAGVYTVVGGTDQWAEYIGKSTATGSFVPTAGGEGTWSGLTCATP